MPVTVLVVDDSAFFRQRISAVLEVDPRISVVGMAENGQVAVEKAQQLKPDVITMDYEMPVMNGIVALREIMKTQPTPVLMFSSLTYEGARITLESLEAGAVDFIPKSYQQLTSNKGNHDAVLIERVLAVARTPVKRLLNGVGLAGASVKSTSPSPLSRTQRSSPASGLRSTPATSTAASSALTYRKSAIKKLPKLAGKCSLVIIGTSTGGPVAVQKVLTKLPANFPVPILIVQHMPKAFTGAFADRLDQQCQIEVREAVDGDLLKPGVALIAPGGQQLMVEKRAGGQVKIFDGEERLNYKPCVDVTFGSAANKFGNRILGIVLTGMGADGREGARMLKSNGSTVWAQNEESCVIYGMPHAVVEAQLADQILDLSEVSDAMITALNA